MDRQYQKILQEVMREFHRLRGEGKGIKESWKGSWLPMWEFFSPPPPTEA
jgi:hypothetical protein